MSSCDCHMMFIVYGLCSVVFSNLLCAVSVGIIQCVFIRHRSKERIRARITWSFLLNPQSTRGDEKLPL